jgi:hypothetical protein
MEMSPAYAAETAEALSQKGFSVMREPLPEDTDGVLVYEGDRYTFEAEGERLVLEVLTYVSDGEHAYFLEIADFHGLRTFSFPLDSWKHRDNRIEFKFVADPRTAMGLAFTVPLPR